MLTYMYFTRLGRVQAGCVTFQAPSFPFLFFNYVSGVPDKRTSTQQIKSNKIIDILSIRVGAFWLFWLGFFSELNLISLASFMRKQTLNWCLVGGCPLQWCAHQLVLGRGEPGHLVLLGLEGSRLQSEDTITGTSSG